MFSVTKNKPKYLSTENAICSIEKFPRLHLTFLKHQQTSDWTDCSKVNINEESWPHFSGNAFLYTVFMMTVKPLWCPIATSLGIFLRYTLLRTLYPGAPKRTLPAWWGTEDTYRFGLGGVEQVFEGFVCCPQQRPDRTGPFLSVFFSSLFRIVAQECTKEARVGVLHQFDLHRPIQILSYGRRYQLNVRINIQA